MDTTFKSESGIRLLVGNTVITITPAPANGQLPTKRAYRRRKATAGEVKRPVGRPRKVVQPQEA